MSAEDVAAVLHFHRIATRNAGGRTGCRGCQWQAIARAGSDAAYAEWAAHVAGQIAALHQAEVDRLNAALAEAERQFIRLAARNADNQILRDEARDRAEKAEAALAGVRAAFWETFTPDFGGVDWRDDKAIQTFARKFLRLLDGA